MIYIPLKLGRLHARITVSCDLLGLVRVQRLACVRGQTRLSCSHQLRHNKTLY